MVYVGSEERMQAHVLQSFRYFFSDPVRYSRLDRGEINKEAAVCHQGCGFGRDSDSFFHWNGEDHNVRGGCIEECSRFDLYLFGGCPGLVDLSSRYLHLCSLETGESCEETSHSSSPAHDQDSCLIKFLA